MKKFETIELRVDKDCVATLTLARSDKHNALNEQLIAELHEAAVILAEDKAVRVIVLAAKGKSFCAGGDLGWMRDQINKDRAGRMEQATKLATMLRALDELPKPLIGRVHGLAYGGGIGLMSVCDIVVSSSDVKFSLSETRYGIIPATIAPYVVRRMGEGNARQIFMNAKVFDATTAARLGLVSTVVAADELDEVVGKEVRYFLSCAPGAVTAAKALCCKIARTPPAEHILETSERLADRWESEEALVGIKSFFAKEKAPWTNSD